MKNKNLDAIVEYLYKDADRPLPEFGYVVAKSLAEAQLFANRAMYWGEANYDKPLPSDYRQETFDWVINYHESLVDTISFLTSVSIDELRDLCIRERVMDMLMFDTMFIFCVAPAEEWNRAVSAIKAHIEMIQSRLP